MSALLTANSAIVTNSLSGSTDNLSVWLYDRNEKLVLTVDPGQVSDAVSFVAHSVRFLNFNGKEWFFPNNITLNPGDVIVFTPVRSGTKNVTVFSHGVQTNSFTLKSSLSSTMSKTADVAMAAHTDPYLHKVFTLAKLHVLMGSTRDEFNADLKARAFTDTTPTKKLTREQFDLVNKANSTVRLEGTASDESDQDIYDETAMLCTAVNTRLAAIANAAHPDQWDISVPENQIKMVNAAANGLFNWYYSHMGQFLTSVNMTSSQVKNSYNTTTIKLDALVDLFKSLSLPGDKLQELSGAVDSFVESMSTLSSESTDKGLKNAKLTNFFSIQPPVGSPTLAKVSKMRMFYLQFNEATHEWSNSCSSGTTYELDTSVFQLDVEINRQVCHLTYEHNRDMVVANAEAALDEMGAAGVDETVPAVKTNGPSPIGPAPVS